MSNVKRRATAIHEASHAVVSYLLGLRFVHAHVLSDSEGEVVPESSVCGACVEYLERHDPTEDERASRIENDLRSAVAVALAGQIGEVVSGAESQGSPDELIQDDLLARSRTAASNLWSCRCYQIGSWESGTVCPTCQALLDETRRRVREMLGKSQVQACVLALAERLATCSEVDWSEAVSVLSGKGLRQGSEIIDSQPGAGYCVAQGKHP